MATTASRTRRPNGHRVRRASARLTTPATGAPPGASVATVSRVRRDAGVCPPWDASILASGDMTPRGPAWAAAVAAEAVALDDLSGDALDPLERLVARMVQREEDALADLYERTVDRVFALARTLTGNAADAEEVACDVYSRAWDRAAGYEPTRGSVMAWLCVMCRSRAVDLIRSRRVRQRTDEQHEVEGGEQAATPDDVLSRFQSGSAVRRALAELSDDRRQIVALAFLRGFTHGEIADTLSLPLGTVKSRIRRAIQELRTLLESFA